MNTEQLKAKYGDEKVLCIPRRVYEADPENWNFLRLTNVISDKGFFAYRYEVEMDESILQVIPYVVLKHEDKYFITKRIAGDERLKGMTAFLGGHIDEKDGSVHEDLIHSYDVIVVGMFRELTEETTLDINQVTNILAADVFVDESSQVSRCHICQLMIVEVDSMDIEIKETEKLEGGWVTLDELKVIKDSGKAEGWCKIAIDILTGGK